MNINYILDYTRDKQIYLTSKAIIFSIDMITRLDDTE
jgi:hypothetical protein